MTFSEYDPSQKVAYLEGCLPSTLFNEVAEGHSDYTSETVDELLYESKNLVKERMEIGWDHWEYLKDYSELTETQLLGRSYRELLYYSVSMDDSNLKTHPHSLSPSDDRVLNELKESSEQEIRDFLLDTDNEETELALSPVGVDIWEKVSESPTLRLIEVEDSNHIFFEFWLKTGIDREYHWRKGEFIEFPTIRRVSCRLHLDDDLVELAGRSDRKRDRELVLRHVEDILRGSITVNRDKLEIYDSTIRHFLELDNFLNRPHSKKAGVAQSSWTTSDRDVSEDDVFPEHRDNEQSNLRFKLDPVGEVGFQLSAEDNTFRIFAQKMAPPEHITVAEFIRENIGEANE